MTDLLNVTVSRAKWFRGQGSADSKLLVVRHTDPSQVRKMCCLGFACLAAGLTEAQIADMPCPSNILRKQQGDGDELEFLPAPLMQLVTIENDPNGDYESVIGDSGTCELFTETNDALLGDGDLLTEADREARIVALGIDVGIAFTFVD